MHDIKSFVDSYYVSTYLYNNSSRGLDMKTSLLLLFMITSLQFSNLLADNQEQYKGPYQSFSNLPPDDDEIRQNEYPASGSGRIVPPGG